MHNVFSISWILLIATEGGANKWYHTHSVAPSKPIIVVILVAVCIALVMDGFDVNLYVQIRRMHRLKRILSHHNTCTAICVTIVLQLI